MRELLGRSSRRRCATGRRTMFFSGIRRCRYRLLCTTMAGVASYLRIASKGAHFEGTGVNRLDHLEHRPCDLFLVYGIAGEVAHGVAISALDTKATAGHEHSSGKLVGL